MSTSLLYQGFGVRDYRHMGTKYVRGGVVFTRERKMETCRCTACGSENVWQRDIRRILVRGHDSYSWL